MSDLLTGEFADKPNDYTAYGVPIVSWELIQNKPKNPTYGLISLCGVQITSSKGYTEIVTILKGELEAEVNGVKSVFKRGQELTAPPNSTLKLGVKKEPVFYFCQYK